MTLSPMEKIFITYPMSERTNAQVIGIKPEKDGTQTYMVQTLRKDFLQPKPGPRIVRITAQDIAKKRIKIERHDFT